MPASSRSTSPDAETLLVHPSDDVVVALKDLHAGQEVAAGDAELLLTDDVSAKHKFARRALSRGEAVKMYGITVGKTTTDIQAGGVLTTANLHHATDEVVEAASNYDWQPPDIRQFSDKKFNGYVRSDGRVGTRNYWIVLPLVFCENRNLQTMSDALLRTLGYAPSNKYQQLVETMVSAHQSGETSADIVAKEFALAGESQTKNRVFPNVDGIRFLRHEQGCGGNYQDAVNLCRLFAGYINNPNVAGATVLSLGCQKSQVETLQSELDRLTPKLDKPVYVFEQQQLGSEENLLQQSLKHTFAGVMEANKITRQPMSLDHLTVGVECGGSDGFSGLSANPAIGHCSDLVVALGGSVILSEFPELAGCEQDLTQRCADPAVAKRFLKIMRDFEAMCQAVGGGFDQNPSPGNIRDGLITDAMKSAGAAKKGGSSPIADVLDYPEIATKRGLNLLCTPGGDVESTTAKAGAGANIQLFSTGLGTPTGNAISPVIKIATNTSLSQRMSDIIDVNAGTIITGEHSIEQIGEVLLDKIISVASGTELTKAEQLGQNDFIPWKRGISF